MKSPRPSLRISLLWLLLLAIAPAARGEYTPPPETRTVVVRERVGSATCSCPASEAGAKIQQYAANGYTYEGTALRYTVDGVDWVQLNFGRYEDRTVVEPVPPGTRAGEALDDATGLLTNAEDELAGDGESASGLVDGAGGEVNNLENPSGIPPTVPGVENGTSQAQNYATPDPPVQAPATVDTAFGAAGTDPQGQTAATLLQNSGAAQQSATQAAGAAAGAAAPRDAAATTFSTRDAAIVSIHGQASAGAAASDAVVASAAASVVLSRDVAATPAFGDPVRVATGELVVSETDVEIDAASGVALGRLYASGATTRGRAGAAWVSTLDERILIGFRPDADAAVRDLATLEADAATALADAETAYAAATTAAAAATEGYRTAAEQAAAAEALAASAGGYAAAAYASADAAATAAVFAAASFAAAAGLAADAQEAARSVSATLSRTIDDLDSALARAAAAAPLARDAVAAATVALSEARRTGNGTLITSCEATLADARALVAQAEGVLDQAAALRPRAVMLLGRVDAAGEGATALVGSLPEWQQAAEDMRATAVALRDSVAAPIVAGAASRLASLAGVPAAYRESWDAAAARQQEIAALGARLVEARQRVAELRAARERAEREARYSEVALSRAARGSLGGADPSLQASGVGTAVYVDPSGVRHLYTLITGPDWNATATLADGGPSYYPHGSDATAARVGEPRLVVEADGSYTLTERDGTIRRFDLLGRIAEVADPNGNAARYEYDAAGDPSAVVDAYGRRYGLRTAAGLVSSVVLPDGLEILYGYDASSRLASVRDEVGDETGYEYEGTLLTGVLRPDGSRITYRYSRATDRWVVAATVDEEGAEERFEYDFAARTGAFTSSSGVVTRHEYDERLCEVRTVSSDGSSVAMSYDEDGNLLERVDETGRRWSRRYDAEGRPVSGTDPTGATERWGYADRDRLAWAQDALGRVTRYDYDSRGNLVVESRLDGSWLSFGYDERGRVLWEADELGNRTEQGYDEWGNLAWRRGPEGETERFEYDARGRLVKQVDGAGVERTVAYTTDGRVASVAVAGIPRVAYTYTNRKDRATAADALGNVTRLAYDRRHLLVAAVNAAEETVAYGYRADGSMVSKQVGEVSSWEYRYDLRGRLAAKEQLETGLVWRYEYDAAGRLVAEQDPEGGWTRYELDGAGRLIRSVAPDGGERRIVRDAAGNPLVEIDEVGGERRYEYDVRGRVVSVTDPTGASRRYEYDARGSLVRSVDSLGGVSENGYDRSVRPVWSTDPTGARRRIGYDGAGRVVWREEATGGRWSATYTELGAVAAETDPLGAVTRYDYDLAGNLVAVTDPLGGVRRLEYDAVGRLRAEVDAAGARTEYSYHELGGVARLVDPLGAEWLTEYDGAGRVVARADPLGGRSAWEYTGRGEVAAEIDPLGARRSYAYDSAGRRVAQQDPGGAVTEWGYEARGLTAGLRDPNGNETSWWYDGAGRVSRERNALGTERNWSYDAAGNLQASTDFAGRATTQRFDGAGRAVRQVLPDGVVRTWIYDAEGRVVAEGAGGLEATYRYDAAGRLVEWAGGATGESVEYEYDAAGRRVRERRVGTDGLSRVTSYGYDAAGRLTSVTDPAGRTIRIEYDAAGREVSRTLAGSLVEERRYDAAGRVTSVRSVTRTGSFAQAASGEGYVYDAAGRRRFTVDEEGHVQAYRYDEAGRLVEVLTPWSDAVARHGLSRLADAGFFPRGTSPESARPLSGATEYSRLWSPGGADAEAILRAYEEVVPERKWTWRATQVAWTDRYGYDAGGNRTSAANGWGAVESRYGVGNRLASSGMRRYAYDANGNLAEERLDAEVVAYRYTGDDRVAAVSRAGDRPVEVRYGYDALGRRVSRLAWTPAGSTGSGSASAPALSRTLYGYDGRGMVRQTETEQRVLDGGLAKELREGGDRYRPVTGSSGAASAGGLSRMRVVAGSRVLATISGGGYAAYATDVLGSTREAVGEDGGVVEYSYDPFGDLVDGPDVAGRTTPELIAYTGKPLDVATGQYDYGFRDYAPRHARFTTIDPARDGPNWYAYVNNDPVNWVDPWGLRTSDRDAAYWAEYASQAVERGMREWNLSHEYTSADFVPGSQRTDRFGQAQGPYIVGSGPGGQVQWYQTTHHAGVDRAYAAGASPSPVVAPAYLSVVETSGNRITLRVEGTQRNVSIMHLNPDDVSAVSRGQVFAPGDVIAPFPSQSFGTAAGDPHIHIQESNVVSGVRAVVDPDTHRAVNGQSYQYRAGVSASVRDPAVWSDWASAGIY